LVLALALDVRAALHVIAGKFWIVSMALACLALAVLFHTSGGQDDTYITYWPARTLAEQGQILNYNGERLEQSSSLSLVLLLALLYKLLPATLPTIGYLTGLALGAVTLLLAGRIGARAGQAHAWLVMPALGTVACFSYWATSGTETTLVAASELWMVLELDEVARKGATRRSWVALCACFVFVASRPESPLVAAAVVTGLAAASLSMWRASGAANVLSGRAVLRVALVVAGAIATLLTFRRSYFGAWLPNPANMKADGFNYVEGIGYVWHAFNANGPHWFAAFLLALLAALHTLATRSLRSPLPIMVAALASAHLAFAVLSGGDWMNGARFLALAMPALVLSAFVTNVRWLQNVRVAGAITTLFVSANLLYAVQSLRRNESEGRPLWTVLELGSLFAREVGQHGFSPVELGNNVHLRDAVTIYRFLPIVARITAAKRGPVWIMTGQAGMVGYHVMSRYFRRAKLLDLWSLTTRELYDCFPPNALSGGKYGSWIELEDAFRQLTQGGPGCHAPMPDIYYNECLGAEARATLEKYGYVVLYEQTGTVQNGRGEPLFPGQVPACGHFAVSKSIALELGLRPTPPWSWTIVPQ